MWFSFKKVSLDQRKYSWNHSHLKTQLFQVSWLIPIWLDYSFSYCPAIRKKLARCFDLSKNSLQIPTVKMCIQVKALVEFEHYHYQTLFHTQRVNSVIEIVHAFHSDHIHTGLKKFVQSAYHHSKYVQNAQPFSNQ